MVPDTHDHDHEPEPPSPRRPTPLSYVRTWRRQGVVGVIAHWLVAGRVLPSAPWHQGVARCLPRLVVLVLWAWCGWSLHQAMQAGRQGPLPDDATLAARMEQVDHVTAKFWTMFLVQKVVTLLLVAVPLLDLCTEPSGAAAAWAVAVLVAVAVVFTAGLRDLEAEAETEAETAVATVHPSHTRWEVAGSSQWFTSDIMPAEVRLVSRVRRVAGGATATATMPVSPPCTRVARSRFHGRYLWWLYDRTLEWSGRVYGRHPKFTPGPACWLVDGCGPCGERVQVLRKEAVGRLPVRWVACWVPRTRTIYVSFGGTETWTQAQCVLTQVPRAWPWRLPTESYAGTVHQGFLQAWHTVCHDVLEWLAAVVGRHAAAPPHVVFTGHSLGGVLANMAAVHAGTYVPPVALAPGAAARLPLLCWPASVQVITWGTPPIGTPAWVAHCEAVCAQVPVLAAGRPAVRIENWNFLTDYLSAALLGPYEFGPYVRWLSPAAWPACLPVWCHRLRVYRQAWTARTFDI